jgi:hypothetical protein
MWWSAAARPGSPPAATRAAWARTSSFPTTSRQGGAWQHTWDSPRLLSPAAHSSLPGRLMPPQAGETYPDAGHVVEYLADYEKRYGLPVQHGVRVCSVRRIPGNDQPPPHTGLDHPSPWGCGPRWRGTGAGDENRSRALGSRSTGHLRFIVSLACENAALGDPFTRRCGPLLTVVDRPDGHASGTAHGGSQQSPVPSMMLGCHHFARCSEPRLSLRRLSSQAWEAPRGGTTGRRGGVGRRGCR